MKQEDVVVAGAGPIGIACAISAKRRGLDPLLVDAGAVVNSIVRYPIGMSFFTTPELMEIGGHPLTCSGEKPTREEALMYYRNVVRREGLRTQLYAKLIGAKRVDDVLVCELRGTSSVPVPEEIRCRRLVLATGYYDQPRLMGVPGEDLQHVSHYFDEAHRSFGLKVVVIGGRNSAVEAALALFRAGADVTLIYRGTEFPPSVKYWIKPDIENRIRAGEIRARLGAEVRKIDRSQVHIRDSDGKEESLEAHRVYALTGFLPDTDLFRRIGIEIDADSGKPAIDPETRETNVPGVYMAGSITAGYRTSDIFIENGRFDGNKIFGE